MKSIFRATAILSSSSLATILFAVATAKIVSVLVGPAGYGYLGLLQSLLATGALLFGMGVSTALVKEGALSLSREDQRAVGSLREAALLLSCALGGLGAVLLVLFRAPIGRWMLGQAQHSLAALLIGAALTFTLLAATLTSTLNAHHRIKELAKTAVLTSILSNVATILLVWRMGVRGILPAVVFAAAVSLVIVLYFVRKNLPSSRAVAAPSRADLLNSSQSLLRFGVPYMASLLVGTGVNLVLPSVILHTLGINAVGFYRASVAISVGYLGFMLAAMAQDYYPRVSAMADRPDQLVDLVNQQHRLIMLVVAPIILAALAITPFFVPILYSAKFYPTVDILEWQLIGDLFKFSSWTMSYVILVRCSTVVYFLTELSAGVLLATTSYAGIRLFGLPGLGMAFLLTYVFYYAIVSVVVRREIKLIWTSTNKGMMLVATAMALVIRIIPFTSIASFRTAIALSFAAIAGVISLFFIHRDFTGRKLVLWGTGVS
jgi:PST family polysaccharide transporter